MRIESLLLLPKDTRILFDEATRNSLFSKKEEIMSVLTVHRNTVNSWVRGEYKPSIGQLETLGIDMRKLWKHVVSIGVEGSTKEFLIPKYLPTEELSWVLGILDGDGFNDGHRIGIINQDLGLVKEFIETCEKIFSIKPKQIFVSVQWYNDEHSVAEELCIDEVKTYAISQYKSNKPVVKAVFTNKIISSLMSNFKLFMTEHIKRDNTEPFLLYIRGLMDSDGSFARKNMYLTQKYTEGNIEKMKIVQKMLDSAEIENFGIKGPNNKQMIYVYLSASKNTLRKYQQKIGFCSQPKLNKLNTLLS